MSPISPMSDIWIETYKRDSITRSLSVLSAINPGIDGDTPRLVSKVEVEQQSENCRMHIDIHLSAGQMREFARQLSVHADRIEQELQPRLLKLTAAPERQAA